MLPTLLLHQLLHGLQVNIESGAAMLGDGIPAHGLAIAKLLLHGDQALILQLARPAGSLLMMTRLRSLIIRWVCTEEMVENQYNFIGSACRTGEEAAFHLRLDTLGAAMKNPHPNLLAIYLPLLLALLFGCGGSNETWLELLEHGKQLRGEQSVTEEERFSRAESLYLEALVKLEKALGNEPVRTADMRELFNEIESLFFTRGKQAELEPLFRKKIELYSKYLGEDQTLTGAAHEGLGHLYKRLDRKGEAEEQYRVAMTVYAKRGRSEGEQRMRDQILAIGGLPGASRTTESPALHTADHPRSKNALLTREPASREAYGLFAGSDQPFSLTSADYDQLLSGQPANYTNGIRTTSGPLALQLDRWTGSLTSWKGEPCTIPFISINLMLVDLPGPAEKDVALGSLTIESVWGRGGDLHDTRVAPVQELSFQRETTPRPHLAERINIYLKESAGLEDITRIQGTVRLRLPLGIRVYTLSPLSQRQEVPADSPGIELGRVTVEGQSLKVAYSGELECWLDVFARDESGRLLGNLGFGGGSMGNQAEYEYRFDGRIGTVEAAIADGFIERSYDFTLTR